MEMRRAESAQIENTARSRSGESDEVLRGGGEEGRSERCGSIDWM